MIFDTDNLRPADILEVRSPTAYGKAIRGVLGSFGNHHAMVCLDTQHTQWWIGEAVPPKSRITSLQEYERLMSRPKPKHRTIVRVWRVPDVTDEVRQGVSDTFLDTKIGLPYPMSVARMWIYRFVNYLPYRIPGDWCTRIVWDAWTEHVPDVFRHVDGRPKRNPTPRTLENRHTAGCTIDVTRECLNTELSI